MKREIIGYAKANKLEIQKRQQYVINLLINKVERKDIVKLLMKEYEYSKSQANKLFNNAIKDMKQLLKKNKDNLGMLFFAKYMNMLREMEDDTENDRINNMQIRRQLMKDIRELVGLDESLKEEVEKNGEVRLK